MPTIIDVNQKKISIGDKYVISINGQPVYKAKSSIWKLFPKIDLMRLQGDQVFLTMEQGWGFLKPNVVFNVGGSQFKLETISWWKRRFLLVVGSDRFEIIGHRGRKVSIFQNDRQIAWFDNAAVTFFNGDNYHCTANSTASSEWLIAFILFWDAHYNREQKSAINFKFGSMVQSQAFDTTWQAI
ncbi:MAG: hypothetical protein NT084_15780 [Bacteroidetes bacterium]|nr:hypothetical protein [Bacteroidota bacterium]